MIVEVYSPDGLEAAARGVGFTLKRYGLRFVLELDGGGRVTFERTSELTALAMLLWQADPVRVDDALASIRDSA